MLTTRASKRDKVSAFNTDMMFDVLDEGRPIGGHGSLTCFSFHPRKVITTGEGGMITTDDVALAERLRLLRQHGMSVRDTDRHSAKQVVIEDYVWIASRAMILPSHIRRGAVVAAQALVTKDVGELEVVGGVPAKVLTKRNPDALGYSAHYRPLFF